MTDRNMPPEEAAPVNDSSSVAEAMAQVASTIPEGDWSRFHWATPLLSLWKVWAALAAAAFSILLQVAEEGFSEVWQAITGITTTWVLIVAGGALALSLLVILMSWLVWRKQAYVLAPSGVHYRSGIFSGTHRHVRWDRIQSVEIKQGIIPRLLGLGSIMIDSASSSGSNLSLGLLKMNEIQALRSQILTIASAARAGTEFSVDRGESVGDLYDPDDAYAAEKPFYQLPTGRLVGSILLSGILLTTLGALAAVLVPLIWLDGGFSFGLVVAAGGTVAALWGQFNLNHGLKLFLTRDGIRVRRGLTTTTTQTIPPRRIHAVTLEQPFLWRRKDWWKVKILIAGSVIDEDSINSAMTRSTIMPVGTRADALDLLWTIIPSVGVDDLGGFFDDALSGTGPSRFFAPTPPSARYLDPFRRRRNGLVLTSTVAAHRDGWLTRRLTVALHGHWQGLKASQGPVQARLGLGTFELSLVAGDTTWSASNFSIDQVWGFLSEERQHGLHARAVNDRESIEQWSQRVGVA
ncbi:PH domain-containing protein [Flaviflexus equikiangi]|uniref:PH domain-containing protein n=1 Tax=Flaviflexus equikiangi TaxID=2758573 RepID=A0ABS2TIL6_9ACTO|nr:PH domain-containing protein [Flaviflexus equikiangi]MBM9433622.1 PH domain-containing protein [Flaviflexus equikiangi]